MKTWNDEVNATGGQLVMALGAVACVAFGAGVLWEAERINDGVFAWTLIAVGAVLALVPAKWAKKERSLAKDAKAVSPVIAVILMVAITVVLAATVFVLVQDIGGQTASSAPQVGWAPDETQDRLAVNSAVQSADWQRLEVKGNVSGLKFNRNADASTASGTDFGTTFVKVSSSPARIMASDYLDLCSTSGVKPVKLTLRDAGANQVVWEGSFINIQACA